MDKISVILVKNYFFILLHKFNLYNLICDSLKFQTSITNVHSLWPGCKGNDLQGRHRKFNKTFASSNEEFSRNKLFNKYGKQLRKF